MQAMLAFTTGVSGFGFLVLSMLAIPEPPTAKVVFGVAGYILAVAAGMSLEAADRVEREASTPFRGGDTGD